MNSKIYITRKFRVISSLCLIALSGCGGNAERGSVSTSREEVVVSKRPQTVVISRVSTIPTNIGSSYKHTIKIDNNTGKNLTLQSFKLSDSAKTSLISGGYSTPKLAKDAVGYDSRISVATCSNLAAGSSCSISFTPDKQNGSVALKLNFVDDRNNLYPAAQLLEYSSDVNEQDGFYVSNAQIGDVATTNNYSIAIPFISDDAYKSIEINSQIITLSKSLDCKNGAMKGQHCTALLTLPAADPKSGGYRNIITIKGTKANGETREARLQTGTTYNDTAHLAITSGPIIIKATPQNNRNQSLTKNIQIVNNGVNKATNISDLYHTKLNSSNKDEVLTKTMTCDGNPNNLNALPTDLDSADICTVSFTLNDTQANGYADYKVSYTNGINGATPTTTSTLVYFMGLTQPNYAFTITGNADAEDIGINSSVSSTLKVTNTGTNDLVNINGTLKAKDWSISNSTCGSGKLEPGNSCTYTLTYAPTSEQKTSYLTFEITAGTDDSTITGSRIITYSAKTNGDGLIIISKSSGYSIFSNNQDFREARVLIQNTGNEDFNLNSITTTNWSSHLTTSVPNEHDGITNPLNGAPITDGTLEAGSTYTIGSKQVAALDYKYGPTSQAESGRASQVFNGNFSNGSNSQYSTTHYINYQSVLAGIKVTKEDIAFGIKSIDTTDNNPFYLTSDNQATVIFKYTAIGENVHGFLVNDSYLPFGFMVDSSGTTCPTTSKNDTASTIVANNSCVVKYVYLATELSNSIFYTMAVSTTTTITAPSYSIAENNEIHVVQPYGDDVSSKLTATSFMSGADIEYDRNKNETTNFNDGKATKMELIFITGVDYDLKELDIKITPKLPPGFYSQQTFCKIHTSLIRDENNYGVYSCPITVFNTTGNNNALDGTAIEVNYSIEGNNSDFNSLNSRVNAVDIGGPSKR